MPSIVLFTYIKAPAERCFNLSRNIELHTLSTARTHEKAVAGKTSGLISKGETVMWEAVHFGIRQHLSVEIVDMRPPYFFSDRMIRGAFKSMYHEHHFYERNGTTLMKDIFNYESPLGVIGKLFNAVVLHEYMKGFLAERNNMIKAFAEGETWQQLL